jgi:hypothetical protein
MHKIGKVAVMPIIIAAGGFIVPETRSLPVAGAGPADWNPHLHYSIMSLLPLPSNYGFGMPLGWLRMFYIDPHDFLTSKDA